jgi:hypothetical protein
MTFSLLRRLAGTRGLDAKNAALPQRVFPVGVPGCTGHETEPRTRAVLRRRTISGS